MNPNNYMAHLGATLVDRGYAILPIQPSTKKPGMFRMGAWQDYPKWSRHCERDTTENEVDIWGDWPEAGIGIAAGKVIEARNLAEDLALRALTSAWSAKEQNGFVASRW